MRKSAIVRFFRPFLTAIMTTLKHPFRKTTYRLLGGLALGSSSLAVANDAALQCTLLNNNAARLACFDTVYATHFPPAAPLPAAQNAKPALDLVQTVNSSIENKEATPVLSTAQVVPSPTLAAAAEAYTPLSKLFDLDQNDPGGILTVRAHHPMYLLPGWFNSNPNYRMQSPTQALVTNTPDEQKKIEAKMQISFKTKSAQDLFKTRADLWFGYTQQAHWQVYNGFTSAPFRNTDYAPEIFLTQPVKADLPGDGRLRMLGVGAIHQSNGKSDPLSRSWNRIYGMAGMEWGKLTVMPRVWWRIPEKASDDNNPDINRYLGYGDVRLQYRFDNSQTLGSTLRLNPKSGKGSMQLDYTFPVAGKLKGYVQGFYGYGESLLDYNHKHRSIGIGLMMNDWDGF